MNTATLYPDNPALAGAPAIPGLRFRRYQGAADLPKMLEVSIGSKAADSLEEADTLEGLTVRYEHLNHCDPRRDILMVEAAGQLVGFGRTYWQTEVSGDVWRHNLVAWLLPAWRRRGVGRAMLHWLERRSSAISAELAPPRTAARFFQIGCAETEVGKAALIEREGYQPVRYSYVMVRPNLDDIPDAPMPPGLEVRPVQTEQVRAIWEADLEAFADHWGEEVHTEADYERWLNIAEFQPEIWKVAWDTGTNEMAGMVLGFINHEQNARYQRRRGWTENISVRRPWRRRGLAHALIAESLRELKGRGMLEAALGVDTENVSGALRVYESMGFRPVRRDSLWRKSMGQAAGP